MPQISNNHPFTDYNRIFIPGKKDMKMSEILVLTQVELREKEEKLEAKVIRWIKEHSKELQAMSREESDKKLKEAQERFSKEVFPKEVRIKVRSDQP